MESECALPSENDFELLCTENREFLYNTDGITTPATLTSPSESFQELKEEEDDDDDKMASSFGESSVADSTVSSKTSCSPTDGEKPKKVRKRNSLRDKMRSAAEQNAYRKLREVVPSLGTVKKPTKLQTIRHTLKFIERLQDKLYELEGPSAISDDSPQTRQKDK